MKYIKFSIFILSIFLILSFVSAVDIYYDPASKLDHNKLSNLQGTGTDYYHLNQTQYDAVLNINGTINSSSYWTSSGGVLSPKTTTDSVNIASGEAYTQNGVDLIKVPSTSATSLCIGDTGFTGTGNDNLMIGENAGGSLTNSEDNVLVGTDTGRLLSTGYGNSFFGKTAGEENVGGHYNTYLGEGAGRYQTDNNNVAIGRRALYGVSGSSNGEQNIALGTFALHGITTGDYNVALGNYALEELTSGRYNFGLGSNAGNSVTNAGSNVFIGYDSGKWRTSSYNVYIGQGSGHGADGISTGEHNIGIGYYSLLYSTTGSNNLNIGYRSGQGFTTESGCVYLGNEVGKTNLLGSSNKLAIDNEDTATPLVYGDFSTDELTVNGDLDIIGNLTSDNGYTGTCVNTTFIGGIAVSCND